MTKNQANNFVQGLNNILDQLYEVNFNIEKSLSNEFGLERKDKFMTMLRENNMNNTNLDGMKKFLQNMQETTRKLPTLTLTLAFEPNETILKTILQWFLFTLNKQVLLEIDVNKNIIAGATMNYNGKYKDFSVKPQLDQIISRILEPESNNKKAQISSSQRTNGVIVQ